MPPLTDRYTANGSNYLIRHYGHSADPALLFIGHEKHLHTHCNIFREALLSQHYQLITVEPDHFFPTEPSPHIDIESTISHHQIKQILTQLPIKPTLIAEGRQATEALLCLGQSDVQLATSLILINLNVQKILLSRVKTAAKNIEIPILRLNDNAALYSDRRPNISNDLGSNRIEEILKFLEARTALGLPT